MTTENFKDAIINMFRVHKRYGAKYALKDINFKIKRNEFVYITGRSGAGKTTLLKLLYLKEQVSEGHILIDGMNLARMNRKQITGLRRKIGIIFQDFKLIPTSSVFDNVALVLRASGINKNLINKKVKFLLRIVGLEDKNAAYPLSLSGGEQQRAAVARAVAANPAIIIADEPTGSLDEDSAALILKLLNEFNARGAAVILATHDKGVIERGDKNRRCIHLESGQITQD
jgi:cell division transport system ATP-binding protein